MNRIDHLFQTKPTGILSVYFTAGYPNLGDTAEIIRTLAARGTDLIEQNSQGHAVLQCGVAAALDRFAVGHRI